MKLSKRTFTVIAGTVLVAIIAVIAFVLLRSQDQDALASNMDRAAVRRGTLIATASATGAIAPLRQAELAFSANGPIAKLDVKQGDRVKAGQLLATLDTRSLDLQLAQSEASLTAAQAKLEQLKNPNPADVAAAEASLTSAQAALAQLQTPTLTDVTIAKADVDKARATLDRAQADYDRIGGSSNPFIAMAPQSVALQQASIDYQRALAAYTNKVTPSDSQLKQAQASVEQARAQLAKLTSPNPGDLKTAQANVDQAQAARDLAKAQVDNGVIRAPFDGIVTHLEYDLGSFAQAGRTVLGVADTSELRVKLNIDETDIARVRAGQPVTIGLDAYPEANVDATVSDVAASATTTQGVVNYVVTVTLGQTEVPIKVGMTANANIVVSKKDNVLLIPNRAIRASNSRRLVTIQKPDGKTQEIEVKLGLANDQETEIISGLNEGDQVLISSTQVLPMGGPFGSNR